MPRRSLGARLKLQAAYTREDGTIDPAEWVIRDGRFKRGTGFGPADCRDAADPRLQEALADYIASQRRPARQGSRHPSQILVADVIAIYLEDVAPTTGDPKAVAGRSVFLIKWFGKHAEVLAKVNGDTCRAYAKHRGNTSARRELEDLRSAINHHRKEGLCSEIVEVVLPDRSPSRERWLTRSEAAKLIWAAYRYREVQKGVETDRTSRRHVARFILAGIYTGTRAGAICGAALQPTPGHGWIDLDRGVFYRRPAGKKETKKRQPAIMLPDRLLAHLRRWHRKKLCYKWLIEFNGDPVRRVNKAFKRAVQDAGLGDDVTPHTLRHTTTSWGMQNSADHAALADYLGMTVETLRKVYGHLDPNYHADVRNAISGRPDSFRQISANKREQTSLNVVKLR